MTVHTSDDAERVQHHPVVRVHPETGREASVRERAVHDRARRLRAPRGEAAPRLPVRAISTRTEFTCRWRWEVGDVAFWDNRCVQHMVHGRLHRSPALHAPHDGRRRRADRRHPPSSVTSASAGRAPGRVRPDPRAGTSAITRFARTIAPSPTAATANAGVTVSASTPTWSAKCDQISRPLTTPDGTPIEQRDDREGGGLPRDRAPHLGGHEAERLQDGEVVATAADRRSRARARCRSPRRSRARRRAGAEGSRTWPKSTSVSGVDGRLDEPVLALAAEPAFELGPPRRPA